MARMCTFEGCGQVAMEPDESSIIARDDNDFNILVDFRVGRDELMKNNGVALLCMDHWSMLHPILYNREGTCQFCDTNTQVHCQKPVQVSNTSPYYSSMSGYLDVVDKESAERTGVVQFCSEHMLYISRNPTKGSIGKALDLAGTAARPLATSYLTSAIPQKYFGSYTPLANLAGQSALGLLRNSQGDLATLGLGAAAAYNLYKGT